MDTLPEVRCDVTVERIRAYAQLTQDFNPLHLDAAFAAGTPMGTVIAHGTMSINLIWQSLATAFGSQALQGAELDVQFVKPVRVNDSLCAGGQRTDGTPGVYVVWVRGAQGDDRIVGSVTLAALAML